MRITAIDDLAFTGRGGTLLATHNANGVDLVRPDGTHTAVLTAADGLRTLTTVAVHGHRVYVPSAAYLTNTDPNPLIARLDRCPGRRSTPPPGRRHAHRATHRPGNTRKTVRSLLADETLERTCPQPPGPAPPRKARPALRHSAAFAGCLSS
ncbi:hypothetical protein TUSST3_68770 [Streptomyces sp. TUS-ST3]|uniref:hypothetical protein n=1 Tax=Streptomyces sp. TUS-ST3 TaxID=3025591 RepID=UPI00235B4814|nr:hypothetical protein [Streptomyces sp. TUS-ST3]GLP70256.1 hypothetical protein TUSST3_68770 [Streptomyces sp. TUS-ST3]